MSQPPRSIAGILTAIAIGFVVLTYALSFVLAAIAMITTPLGPNLYRLNGVLPVYLFALFSLRLIPANGLILIVVCLAIFSACFWAAAKDRGGFIASLTNLTKKSKPTTTPNWLVVMPLLSSSLLIVTVLLSILLNSTGVSVGSLPTTSPEELLASIAYAPVAEEVGFRITPIGLLVIIRTLIPLHQGRGLKRAGPKTVAGRIALALLSPDRAKEAAGLPSIGTKGWRGIHWIEWILLAATSTLFGLAHSLSNSGWGPGKALTAGLTGFALGIVYLWYGSYSDILLHWTFNVYVFVILGSLVGGVYSNALATLSFLATIFLSIAGVVYGIRWLSPVKTPTIQSSTSVVPPPQF
jgi:hypothetical protein